MTGYDYKVDKLADYEPAEIVVDLLYRDDVLHELGEIKEGCAERSSSDEALGLGLIKLTNVTELAPKMEEIPVAPDYPSRRKLPSDLDSDLDKVLDGLRRQYRKANRGWVPEMGKNRTMYPVQGSPHIGTGVPHYVEQPSSQSMASAQNLLSPASNSLGRGVRVGLLDTKLYPAREFFGRVIALENSLLAEGRTYSQLDGHGTFSTGLILARAPGAEVTIDAVLSDGDATSTVWKVATAIVRCAERGESVLVLPLACFTRDGVPPLALQRAVDLVRNKMVVVAAAGNHGEVEPDDDGETLLGLPAYPAACRGVVAVGAVDGDYKPAHFTPILQWVQLVAKGEEVTSTFLSGLVTYKQMGHESPPRDTEFEGFATWSGTSFAAATIGGEIAARITPDKSAFEVVDELRQQDPIKSEGIGGYRLL